MISLLLKKEILNEFRSKESIISMVVFGISIILVISFTINPISLEMQLILPGIFWLTYLFTSIIGFLRLYSSEKEYFAFNLLLLSPIDRGNIFIAKMLSIWIFIIITQLITIPLFILILNFSLPKNILSFILFLLLTNWALSAIGTTISAIGMRTKMSEVLIPMLLYPLLSPIIISAVNITQAMINELEYVNYSFWIMIIFTFSILFTLIGYLTFDIVSEE